MKFEYEKSESVGDPIAKVYKFNGGPTECLAVNTKGGKKVWFYNTGLPDIQGDDWPEDSIRDFYPGDKITITF